MEKFWLKSYPEGIPETIDPDPVSSLVALAEECFKKFSHKPCYVSFGDVLTYKEVDQLSQKFAAYLQEELKLAKGARIVIMLPNVLQYPIVMFGILRAGMTVVNANPLYTPRELSYLLKDSKADCIVALANFAHVLEKALERHPVQHVL